MFKKRLMAMVLATAMILSLAPAWVYADTGGEVISEAVEEEQSILEEADQVEDTDDVSLDAAEPVEDTDDVSLDTAEPEVTDEVNEEAETEEPSQAGTGNLSGAYGPNIRYLLVETSTNEYKMRLYGSGSTYDYTNGQSPIYDYWKNITEVIVEDGITGIGGSAFFGFTNLKKITFGKDVTRIGYGAFMLCSNLDSITLPSGLTSIDGSAFYDCKSLVNIYIPSGVTSIGDRAFSGCSELEFVYIPGTATELTYNVLDDSPATIICKKNSRAEAYAVNYQANYNTVTDMGICGREVYYVIVGSAADGYLLLIFGSDEMTDYGSSDEVPWAAYSESIRSIQIEETIPSIGDYAFSWCTRLETITIPVGVKRIGENAFYQCENLTSVIFPQGLLNIEAYAFSTCYRLTDINLFSRLKSIGANAFEYCTSLRNALIPANVTSIGDNAFYFCDKLTIAGEPGSAASVYAYQNNIPFISTQTPHLISQPSDVTAKVGDPITLHVYVLYAVSCQWQVSRDGGNTWNNSTLAGNASYTMTFTAASENDSEMYRCEMIGLDGNAVYTDPIAIRIGAAVQITSQPKSVITSTGKQVSFTVTADNVKEGGYQWQYSVDGSSWKTSNGTGSKTKKLSVTVSATNKNYLYRCKMTGTDGKIKYSSRVGMIIVTRAPENASVAMGETGTFTVTAENIKAYQWQYSADGGKNWKDSSASTAKTKTLSAKLTETSSTRLYRCKLTNQLGATAYTNAVGFVQQVQPSASITAQPKSLITTVGSSVSFSVTAENVKEGGYQWQYSADGSTWKTSNGTGSTTAKLTVTVSETRKNYVYRLKITGLDGKVTYSDPAGTVVLTKKPANSTAATGSTAKFTAAADNIASYQWQFSSNGGVSWTNSGLSTATKSTLSFTVNSTNIIRTFRCKLTTTNGISVYTDPVGIKGGYAITSQPTNMPGTGSTVTFTVKCTGVTAYQWQYSNDGGTTWKNSTAASGLTNAYTVNVNSTSRGNIYRCKLTGTDGKTHYTNKVKIS